MANPAFGVLVPAVLVCSLAGCGSFRVPAERAHVRTEDVPRFYAALDSAGPDADLSALTRSLEQHYFGPGTPGLRDFLAARIGTPASLATTVREHMDYYQSIRPSVLRIASDQTLTLRVQESFKQLNQWLPDARFPPVYLLIGRMNSAGTVGNSGLLIGLEMFARTPESATAQLDRWASMSLRQPDELLFTIVHESIHTLQTGGNPRTLLEAAIHEGACDFLASLATGNLRNTLTYQHARAREAELWAEFSRVMHDGNWGDWLYTLPQDPNRPPDLAYAIGAFICEAFWQRASDPQAAARMLLDSRNAAEILRLSGYDPSSATRP